MDKLQCAKCNNWFTPRSQNYTKHITSCKGDFKPPGLLQLECVYCQRSFNNLTASERANHTRWCTQNPKANEFRESLVKRRTSLQTPELKEKTKQGVKAAHVRGCYKHVIRDGFKGKTHTEETKEIIKRKALASNHRRLKKRTAVYRGVLLDSSWELALAQRLDELNVKWIRPNPVQWQDEEGTFHHYFPDFYLPEFDLYLDPKNPAAIKAQKKKLEILKKTLPSLIILETFKECQTYTPVSPPPSKRSLIV